MYRALISFCGKVSMAEGEIRSIDDKRIADDLLNAKYIEEVNAPKKDAPKKDAPKENAPKEDAPKAETKKKTSRKRKTTNKK